LRYLVPEEGSTTQESTTFNLKLTIAAFLAMALNLSLGSFRPDP